MSNNQTPSVSTKGAVPATPAAPSTSAVPTRATAPAKPAAPSPAYISTEPILPENTIGVRDLKNQLTRIVSTVRNEQKEYVITVHGKPVAVLRPYTEEDAIQASDQAFEQEMAEILASAKRVSAAWKSEKSAVELLEEMREESACR